MNARNHDVPGTLRNRGLLCSVAALLLLSTAGLLWNQFGMERTFRLDASSRMEIRAIDDSSSGGKTVSSLRRADGKVVMDCDIRAGYAWPYCSMIFELGRPPQGVDLSSFDTVSVAATLDGPEAVRQLRLFALDYNPAFSKPDAPESAKVQELVYDAGVHPRMQARVSQFTVSSWWTNAHALNIEQAGTEFSNVVAVQLSTGGNVVPGHHALTLERIEFKGKVIPVATFRLWVIATWLAASFVGLFFHAMATARALAATRYSKVALEQLNASLKQQADSHQHAARRDPLTGVLNRYGLRDELTKAAQRGDREFFPLAIVFIDIDHFKSINDGHGHEVGDLVIKEFADVISKAIERDDICARWGGEEFLLIFPATVASDARAIAERLRRAVNDRTWPQSLRVTGSFGVAQAKAGDDLVEGIKRADEAMYAAKANGRDRVELNLATAAVPSLPPASRTLAEELDLDLTA